MSLRRALGFGLVASVLFTLVPRAAVAQSTGTIAGAVRDTTGGVLPGVTVEAASPALIEKVRTAVTDDQGNYKIVDLRPGVYQVTFTLPGFSAIKREGVDVSAGFTANVAAELKVGDMQETIVVSGAAPMVDVQNVTTNAVLSRVVIDNLPTGKTFQSLFVLTPGVSAAAIGSVGGAHDVGGSQAGAGAATFLSVHGSRGTAMPLMLDGLKYNNMNYQGGGWNSLYDVSPGIVEEMTMDVAGMSAEADVSGVRVNVVPREGGNVFHGLFFATFTNDSLMGNNINEKLTARGISPLPALLQIYDVTPSFGGPLQRDKIWFFASYRRNGKQERPVGTFYDSNTDDYVYTPDRSRAPVSDFWTDSKSIRMTWQVSPKNRVTGFFDHQGGCSCGRGSATTAPEAAGVLTYDGVWLTQFSWRSPVTNRLLLELAQGLFNQKDALAWPIEDVDTYVELRTNTTFRARGPGWIEHQRNYNGRTSLSYVTGSHAFKVGAQWQTGWFSWLDDAPNDRTLRLLDGVPNSITVYTHPTLTEANIKAHLGIFAQDQWTIGRATFNAGARFDYLNAHVPAQSFAPVQHVGAREFAAVPNVPDWKDITPRLGMAYDLFGNGKTALKASVGKYTHGLLGSIARQVAPVVTSVNQTTRPWTDGNGDFLPQDSELGPLANANFGKTIITTRWDPAFLEGWGKRPYNWETSASIQHELRPGLVFTGGYFHRREGNFMALDNLAVSPGDYDPYCITTPTDARLPGGGGQQLCGLYDINPSRFGQFNNLVMSSDSFGEIKEGYNGFDLSLRLRLDNGVLIQGGTSTGRTTWNNCDLVGKVDNPGGYNIVTTGGITPYNQSNMASPSPLYCDIVPPLQTQFKIFGVYPLPWGVQASATYQNNPGIPIRATHVVTNAQVAPSLGRNLAGGVTSASVELIAPYSMFEDRLNQLDMRVAKTFALPRGTRLQGQFDLYNLLNANAVLGAVTAYGPAWLRPTNVVPARMVKFGVQLDF